MNTSSNRRRSSNGRNGRRNGRRSSSGHSRRGQANRGYGTFHDGNGNGGGGGIGGSGDGGDGGGGDNEAGGRNYYHSNDSREDTIQRQRDSFESAVGVGNSGGYYGPARNPDRAVFSPGSTSYYGPASNPDRAVFPPGSALYYGQASNPDRAVFSPGSTTSQRSSSYGSGLQHEGFRRNRSQQRITHDSESATTSEALALAHRVVSLAENMGGKAIDLANNMGGKAIDLANNIGGKALDLRHKTVDDTDLIHRRGSTSTILGSPEAPFNSVGAIGHGTTLTGTTSQADSNRSIPDTSPSTTNILLDNISFNPSNVQFNPSNVNPYTYHERDRICMNPATITSVVDTKAGIFSDNATGQVEHEQSIVNESSSHIDRQEPADDNHSHVPTTSHEVSSYGRTRGAYNRPVERERSLVQATIPAVTNNDNSRKRNVEELLSLHEQHAKIRSRSEKWKVQLEADGNDYILTHLELDDRQGSMEIALHYTGQIETLLGRSLPDRIRGATGAVSKMKRAGCFDQELIDRVGATINPSRINVAFGRIDELGDLENTTNLINNGNLILSDIQRQLNHSHILEKTVVINPFATIVKQPDWWAKDCRWYDALQSTEKALQHAAKRLKGSKSIEQERDEAVKKNLEYARKIEMLNRQLEFFESSVDTSTRKRARTEYEQAMKVDKKMKDQEEERELNERAEREFLTAAINSKKSEQREAACNL